jgi:hypothetical protein
MAIREIEKSTESERKIIDLTKPNLDKPRIMTRGCGDAI